MESLTTLFLVLLALCFHFILHPLIHTLLLFNLAQDIESHSTLLRFWQRTPTNRTHFLSWLDHEVSLALGAFDRMEFDSFDFVKVERGDHLATHFAFFSLG